MMTELDEAIKHCKEKAEELKNEAENSKKKEEVRFTMRSKFSESLHNSSDADFDVGNIDLTEYNDCLECAAEHEQLAEWLEQLQAIKLLYKEYERFGGGFHYQVGRVFDGDYVLDNKESEDK